MFRFFLILLAVPLTLQAHTACLEGAYTHEFTKNPNDIVWEVVQQAGHYRLIRVADKQSVDIYPLSKHERSEFWKQMLWAPESAKGAECAADKEKKNIICELSERYRQQDPALKEIHFFHVDPESGVMKILRVDE
jgi:hypothetical protein